MIRVYMAGPLFTVAERAHNVRLATLLQALNPRIECVLPQIRGESLYPDLAAVCKDCLDQIKACDVVVACADGADSDSGTALELGFAFAHKVPSIVYRTDFRGSEVDGVNAMLRYTCNEFINVPAYQTSCDQLAERIVVAIDMLFFKER